MAPSQTTDLQKRCDLLRSLHRPGTPLLLPNAWDVATARAVVAAGFPVVATTSGGVAAALGYEDHEGAPADEMLAAAARIATGVEVPVTVACLPQAPSWPSCPHSVWLASAGERSCTATRWLASRISSPRSGSEHGNDSERHQVATPPGSGIPASAARSSLRELMLSFV